MQTFMQHLIYFLEALISTFRLQSVVLFCFSVQTFVLDIHASLQLFWCCGLCGFDAVLMDQLCLYEQ